MHVHRSGNYNLHSLVARCDIAQRGFVLALRDGPEDIRGNVSYDVFRLTMTGSEATLAIPLLAANLSKFYGPPAG